MSDLGGAILLSQQLSLYRVLDSFDQARDNSRAAASDAAWRNHYNNLVNQYNRLLHDANRLADVQEKSLNSHAGQIAELKATNTALVAQIASLKGELSEARTSERFWRGTMRESHPDIFGSGSEEE